MNYVKRPLFLVLTAAAAAAVVATPASADDTDGVSNNLIPQHPVQKVLTHALHDVRSGGGSGSGLMGALR
jgi:hypothetical protein